MAVRYEHCEVRTKTTKGQYSPVRLEQARLVSSLLYGTQLMLYFSFKRHFRSVKFKGLPARNDASNSEKISYHDFENKFIEHPNVLLAVTYGFHFWLRSQSVGITFTIQFFQMQLDRSRRNLSLPLEHLLRIRFRQSAKRLSLILCTSA